MAKWVWDISTRRLILEELYEEPTEPVEPFVRTLEDYSRHELVALCRENGLPGKMNVSRAVLLSMLAEAGITAPPEA